MQPLEMSNVDNSKNTVIEISPQGVEITKDMTRDEQEHWRYQPWTINPNIIWSNTDVGSNRGEHALVVYCKAYQKDIREFDYLLSGPRKISASKSIVIQYRQIYHPIMLINSKKIAMCMVMGWIRKSVNYTLYPPEQVIRIIKMYTLEADCHFRITHYNPLEVVANQIIWEETENFTDEEGERKGQVLLDAHTN